MERLETKLETSMSNALGIGIFSSSMENTALEYQMMFEGQFGGGNGGPFGGGFGGGSGNGNGGDGPFNRKGLFVNPIFENDTNKKEEDNNQFGRTGPGGADGNTVIIPYGDILNDGFRDECHDVFKVDRYGNVYTGHTTYNPGGTRDNNWNFNWGDNKGNK